MNHINYWTAYVAFVVMVGVAAVFLLAFVAVGLALGLS